MDSANLDAEWSIELTRFCSLSTVNILHPKIVLVIVIVTATTAINKDE